MNKKILILFVRRSYLEIEYILSVLKILKEKYFIYTYFEKKKAFDSLLSQSDVYNVWKKINKNYYILNKFNNLYLKILLKILIIFQFNKNSFFKKILSEVHSFEKICNKLKINKLKIKYILSDLSTHSETLNQILLNKKKQIKIVFFQTSPQNFTQRFKKVNVNARPFLKLIDLLLINSKYDFNYWLNFIGKEKIKIIGPSLFYNLNKNKTLKNRNPKILISYNCVEKKYQTKEIKNIKDILRKLIKLEIDIVIKLHPIKQYKYIFDIVNELNSKYISFSSKNLKYLMKENIKAHICSIKTAAGTYSNYFNIPTYGFVTYHHGHNTKSFQIKQNLIKPIDSFDVLKKEIHLILKGDKTLQKKQQNSFKKIYKMPLNKDKFILNLFDNI